MGGYVLAVPYGDESLHKQPDALQLARFLLVISILVFSGFSHARVFEFSLYAPSFVDDGVRDFFMDYTFLSRCSVEIDDSAIVANALVDINSPSFKRLECSIRGGDRTYQFSYGADVLFSDFWLGSFTVDLEYGLLFDSDAKPLRFDSPQISSESGANHGFFDSPERGFFGFSDHSYWGPVINDNFQTPAAVLLEPALIGSTQRLRGDIVSSRLVPPGTQIALLNGRFDFSEQMLRDSDGSTIVNQTIYRNGYLTFDEQLVTPTLRITQAVFQNDANPIRLVHERTTAIIVDKGGLSTDREIELEITDQSTGAVVFRTDENFFDPGASDGQIIFYCNAVTNYCNLDRGVTYKISISLDVGIEYKKEVNVIEILPFAISFFFATPEEFCSQPYCELGVSAVRKTVNESEEDFLLRYPVSSSKFKVINEVPKTFPASTNTDDEAAFLEDLNTAFLMTKKSAVKRGVLLVSKEYDLLHTESTGPGFINTAPGAVPVGLVNLDSSGFASAQGVLHEIGHSFGLYVEQENYDLDPPSGTPATWFDFSKGRIVDSTRGYMGSGKPNDQLQSRNYGVLEASWNTVFTGLTTGTTDPKILVVAGVLNAQGELKSLQVDEQVGFPNVYNEGNTKLVVKSSDDEVLAEHFVNVTSSSLLFERRKVKDSMFRAFNFVIEYPDGATTIELIDSNGLALLSKDIVIQTLRTLTANTARACKVADEITESQMRLLSRLESKIANGDSPIVSTDIDFVPLIGVTLTPSACDLTNSAFGQADDIRNKFSLAHNRLKVRFKIEGGADAVVGDLDNDGDVDRDDLSILMASRNQPANGANDPKDLDGDGQITGLDARKLARLCTRPRCAVL